VAEPLTRRQAAVLAAIVKYTDMNGYPPSLREICERVGTASTNGVSQMLERLEKHGYIERDPMRSRAIRVLVRDPVAIEGD